MQALFCRLGPGSYLFGTQRVSLQLGSRSNDPFQAAFPFWSCLGIEDEKVEIYAEVGRSLPTRRKESLFNLEP